MIPGLYAVLAESPEALKHMWSWAKFLVNQASMANNCSTYES